MRERALRLSVVESSMAALLVLFIASQALPAEEPVKIAEKITQQQALADVQKDFGFVPNLLVELSASPVVPLVYTKSDLLMHQAKLTQKEQQVVQLVVSVFNGCGYCTSAHSKLAEANGVSHQDVLALRKGRSPKDKHVKDIAWTTKTIMKKRGHLSPKDLKRIEAMGIDRAELYEILVHVGRKTIANYAVHIIGPEIDEEFKFTE